MDRYVGKYETSKCINEDSLSKLYLAKNTENGEQVFLQVYEEATDIYQLERVPDVHIFQQLDHPNILGTIELFEIDEVIKKYSIYVMEYIQYRELFDYISITGNFDEETCRYYFKQLISAINYVHSKGISHNKLSSEYLLINDQFNLKIIWNNFKKKEEKNKNHKFMKTEIDMLSKFKLNSNNSESYMPPEFFEFDETNGFAIDMFSVGVVLFIMYIGRPPFKNSTPSDHQYTLFCNNKQQYWNHFKNEFHQKISQDFIIVINGLLEKDPENRFTVDQVLQQQWMKGKTAKINPDEFQQRTLLLSQNEIKLINNFQERQYYSEYVRIRNLKPDLELAIDTTNNRYVQILVFQDRRDWDQEFDKIKVIWKSHEHKCSFQQTNSLLDSTRSVNIEVMIFEYCCGFSISNYIESTSPFNSRICRYIFGQLYQYIVDLNQKDIFHLGINHNSIIINQNLQIKVDYLVYHKAESIFAKQDIYLVEQLKINDIYEAGLVLFYMYFGYLPFQQISDNDQQFKCFKDNRKQFWEYNKGNLKNNQEPLLDDLITLIDGMIELNINLRFNLKHIESNNWFQQQQQTVESNYIKEVFFKRNEQLMQLQEMKNLEQQLKIDRSCKIFNQSEYFSYKQDQIYNFADIEQFLTETRTIQPYDYTMEIQYYTPFLIDFLIRYLLQYFKQAKMNIKNIDTRYTIELIFNECKFELLFWQTPIYNTGISFNLLDGNKEIFKSITENIKKQIQIA